MIRLPALLVIGAAALALKPQSQDARPLLTGAVAKLGGAETVAESGTWIVEGQGTENLTAEAQGLSADESTTRPHEERFAVNVARLAVAWERHTPRNDLSLRWRRFIYRDDSSGVVVWTDSIGSMNGTIAPEARRRSFARRIPHLLVLEAATRARDATLGAERRVGRDRVREVRVVLDEAVHLTLWISSDSLLRAAEYRAWLPGRGDVMVRWEWDRWMRREGESPAWAPSGHRILVGGQAYQSVRYTRFAAGSPAGDSLLSVPRMLTGRSRAGVTNMNSPASGGLPVAGEVSPGVHVINVRGFNIMVVEFATFVVLVEAPAVHPGFETIPVAVTAEIGAEVVARVAAVAKGRPVRFAIITHHHSDHVGSVGAVASLKPTFIVDRESRIAVERMLRAATVTDARVQVVGDRFEISDSGRTLVVHGVGANPHTSDNLFVWLRRERIGFQGDLFYHDASGGAPADRAIMNRFFAEWIAGKGLPVRGVYGVHNTGAADSTVIAGARRR